MRLLILYILLLYIAPIPVFSRQLTANIPYDTNKETGKFYDIRGFKMHCEVYAQGQPLEQVL